MEHINIQVTCGGQGNRREVKMDEYGRRAPGQYSRQNSSEGQNRRGKGDNWRDRGYYGEESDRGQQRGGRGRGFDRRGSHDQMHDSYHSKDRWARDDGQHCQGKDRQRQDSGGKGQYSGRRNDSHNDMQDDGKRNFHDKEQFSRQKGPRHDNQDRKDDNFRGKRDNRDRFGDRFSRNRDFRDEGGRYSESDRNRNPQAGRGGLLHLPVPQAQQYGDHQNQPAQGSGPPGPHNNWSRGHTPEKTSGPPGRERQNSGLCQQKTLFDPNNPSKPIVIEEAKSKLDFKDTDSYPSSPQSPHYMGGVPPPDMYSRGYGPFMPPGYGYGYNMPPPHPAMMCMPPPPGMFFGYQGPLPPQFRAGEEMYDSYFPG